MAFVRCGYQSYSNLQNIWQISVHHSRNADFVAYIFRKYVDASNIVCVVLLPVPIFFDAIIAEIDDDDVIVVSHGDATWSF